MLSLYIKEYKILGNISHLIFPISCYDMLKATYPELIIQGNVCYLEFIIPEEIVDKFDRKKYSELYSLQDLKLWVKYMWGKYYMSDTDILIYKILSKDDSHIDRLERDLYIPRGLLDNKELYEITNYWLAAQRS